MKLKEDFKIMPLAKAGEKLYKLALAAKTFPPLLFSLFLGAFISCQPKLKKEIITYQTPKKETLLMAAIRSLDPEFVDQMLNYFLEFYYDDQDHSQLKKWVNHKNDEKHSAIIIAASLSDFNSATEDPNTKMIAVLLNKGFANPNDYIEPEGDSKYLPILNWAASFKLALVKELVAKGAQLNTVDGEGETPLITVYLSQKYDIVNFLLGQPDLDLEQDLIEPKTLRLISVFYYIIGYYSTRYHMVCELIVKNIINSRRKPPTPTDLEKAREKDSELCKHQLSFSFVKLLQDQYGTEFQGDSAKQEFKTQKKDPHSQDKISLLRVGSYPLSLWDLGGYSLETTLKPFFLSLRK